MSHVPTVLDDLEWRGLIAHSTDRDALRAALAEGRVRFYVGFDPTAPSLHMGNLVQILTARRLQLAGHTPYVLVGGATGLIGDPKESGERTLNSLDTVKELGRAGPRPDRAVPVDFEGDNAATMVNNYDWTASLSTIDFLRDIGKHFPVNRMLARDVVRSAARGRHQLHRVQLRAAAVDGLPRTATATTACTLQFGGSDQWGNITGGVELIRRADGGKAHAFATPLVTKADGTKYGKTEGGALWLDPEMMSPYAFYQFWLNAEDDEGRRAAPDLHVPVPRGDRGPRGRRPRRSPACGRRRRRWPTHVTTLVHGAEETDAAEAAAAALFGGGDLARARVRRPCAAALREAGAARVDRRRRRARHRRRCSWPPGWPRARARPGARSPRAAPTSTTSGSTDPDLVPGDGRPASAARWLVLRRGKKTLAGVEVG